jgi:CBS domain-containing protein
MLTLRGVPLRQVPVVEPETALDEAMRLMREEPLKTVALVGDGTYMGIFNEDALGSELIPRGVDPAMVPVGPYVLPSRVVGRPEMDADQTLAAMWRRGLDVIPVVENNIYLGVVTREDLEKRPAGPAS